MIGQKLGSFQIEAELGTGAMGVVYLGVHEPSGRKAAVKVITGDHAKKGNASSRFEREAKILEQFRHPNIVRYLAYGRSKGITYLAMEFVPGSNLDVILERRGPLPWLEVVELAIQLCEALHYAHDHGVVHRDLKPSNLMLTEKGQLKLTDFGIAKDLDATGLTGTGKTLGTAAYMAPEQIRGTPEVSHKTDLYSLGIVLYQMLVGECPFQGKSIMVLMHNHLTEPAPRASAKVAEIPTALDDLIILLMAKDPTSRPWDAAAVGQSLVDLRDKAEHGRSITMAWPQQGADPNSVAPRRQGKAKAAARTREGGRSIPWLGTALLSVLLVALIALFVYLCLPYNEDQLYRKAAEKMTSEEFSDWRTAQSDYLDVLDRKYPNHKHRDQTEKWRDQIALRQARDRSRIIDRGQGAPPRPGAEELYDTAKQQVDAAVKADRNQLAAKKWRELADSLATDPKNRGWLLLAQERADAAEQKVERIRRPVLAELEKADALERAGKPPRAVEIRREVLKNFPPSPDIEDLLIRARDGVPPNEPPAADTGDRS